mmetsp:Transcript_29257/g.74422  ORF Transcript_29257/g.74422 Transcript_29257/m.74422 type:complete len:255 (+) Transcript_29257:673-1437(+)
MLHRLDSNNDNQVQSMEFFEKYRREDMSNAQHLAGPISLQEYKEAKSRAVHFLNTTLRISNANLRTVSESSSWRVKDSIVDDIAFEAGVPTMQIHDLKMAQASLNLYINGTEMNTGNGLSNSVLPTTGTHDALAAHFLVEVPERRSDEDVVAVLTNDATKERIADHLSSLPNLGQIVGDDITFHFGHVAGDFNFLDSDHNGRLDLEEFTRATRKFSPPMSDEEAHYAWNGLNKDSQTGLNRKEFDADGISEFYD